MVRFDPPFAQLLKLSRECNYLPPPPPHDNRVAVCADIQNIPHVAATLAFVSLPRASSWIDATLFAANDFD
jgi:hypothetical protein